MRKLIFALTMLAATPSFCNAQEIYAEDLMALMNKTLRQATNFLSPQGIHFQFQKNEDNGNNMIVWAKNVVISEDNSTKVEDSPYASVKIEHDAVMGNQIEYMNSNKKAFKYILKYFTGHGYTAAKPVEIPGGTEIVYMNDSGDYDVTYKEWDDYSTITLAQRKRQ